MVTDTFAAVGGDRRFVSEPEAPATRNAEDIYHDCLARFGHNSAEAHVAQIFWRRQRARESAD